MAAFGVSDERSSNGATLNLRPPVKLIAARVLPKLQPTQKCNKAMPPVACAPFFDAPGQWIKKRRMNSARLDDVALNSGEYSSLPLHSARASAPPAPLPAC